MKHRPATPVSDSNRKTEDKQAEDIRNQDPKEGRSLKAEIHQNKSLNESLDKEPKMETSVSSTPPPERRTIKIENHINGSKEKKSEVLESQQKKNEKVETPEKKRRKSNCNDVTAGGSESCKTIRTSFSALVQTYVIRQIAIVHVIYHICYVYIGSKRNDDSVSVEESQVLIPAEHLWCDFTCRP